MDPERLAEELRLAAHNAESIDAEDAEQAAAILVERAVNNLRLAADLVEDKMPPTYRKMLVKELNL